MASISTESGHGGKKSVDSEIPLVPFIDLLLCCVMFLLVTAVWNQLASVSANLETPGNPQSEIDEPDRTLPLVVRVTNDGFHLSSEAGDAIAIPMGTDGEYDSEALAQHLTQRRALDPNATQAIVTADDGVQYAHLVRAMDVLNGSGFPHVTITGAI